MLKKILASLALVATFALPIAANAQVYTPIYASGTNQALASAVAATTNQAFTSTTVGYPKALTLCMSASAATTFTVTQSIDNVTFYGATVANTVTSANYVPAAAGTLCELVSPAAYIKVATSAAVTVTIQLQAAY